MRRFLLNFGVWAAVATRTIAAPGTEHLKYQMETKEGTVEFFATGRPSALKIHGKGAASQGSFTISKNQVTGNASFPLDTLDTGIKLRNNHMKEKYLETAKFPEAKFMLTQLVLPSNFHSDAATFEDLPFEGKLSIHGVQKDVKGKARIEKQSESLSFEAALEIKVSEYSIPSPGFAGITMAEDVKVVVKSSGVLSELKL